METLPIDVRFWGIRLRDPYTDLAVKPWDWDKTHAVICEIVRLCGTEIAETLLGTIVPAVLRDKENSEIEAAAPAHLAHEVRLQASGSRWADVRIALEGELPRIREALARVVGTVTAPSILPLAFADVTVSQGPTALGVPVMSPQGRLFRGAFLRPQDIYTAALAVGVENLLPLDAGARKLRALPPTASGSLPLIRHWHAYRTLSDTAPSASPSSPA